MNAERFAQKVADVLAFKVALRSPEAARTRYLLHINNFLRDLETRFDFFTQVVEDALPTLPPKKAELLRQIWEGMKEHMQATTAEEHAAIDGWLEPLCATSPHAEWMAVIMNCEGGYFADAVNAELRELAAVPGFNDLPSDEWDWDS